MMRSTWISSLLMIGVVACGGKSTPPSTAGAPHDEASAPKLPWEAALKTGAKFELVTDDEGEGVLVATVESVEDTGATRVYHLHWSEEGNGPTTITVAGGTVLVGDAAAKDMQEPRTDEATGGTCYAADYSNPDGCEDVCDASLCLTDAGIVEVDGLYAPNYNIYRAR